MTQQAIIEPSELHALINSGENRNIKILDASFALPGAAQNPYQNFLKSRIPNAAYFDIEHISDHANPVPHMLPSAEQFSSAVSKLGLSNDDFIVVYGQSGMVMGPARVWWSFRVFGHENIAVLNGGLPAWVKEGYALDTTLPDTPAPGNFTATFNRALVYTIDQVKNAAQNGINILDARPENRFTGEAPEPRPGMRSGHIPGSKNLPCMNLVNPLTGKLKPSDELRDIFTATAYRIGDPVLTTCGSGVTACMIALALYELGHQNVPVYDGAWSEWGLENAGTDVARGIR